MVDATSPVAVLARGARRDRRGELATRRRLRACARAAALEARARRRRTRSSSRSTAPGRSRLIRRVARPRAGGRGRGRHRPGTARPTGRSRCTPGPRTISSRDAVLGAAPAARGPLRGGDAHGSAGSSRRPTRSPSCRTSGVRPIAEHHLRMADRDRAAGHLRLRAPRRPSRWPPRSAARRPTSSPATPPRSSSRRSATPTSRRGSAPTRSACCSPDRRRARSPLVLSRLVEAIAVHDARRDRPPRLSLSVGTARYEPGSGHASVGHPRGRGAPHGGAATTPDREAWPPCGHPTAPSAANTPSDT